MFIEKKLQSITAKVKKRIKYYTHTNRSFKPNTNTRFAEVNLGSFLLNKDGGRYSFIFCQLMKFSGFNVVVKLEPRYFLSEKPYKRMLLDQDHRRTRKSEVPSNCIMLHGTDAKVKRINIVYGYKLLNTPVNGYYLPYTLHPRFYKSYVDCSNFQVFREALRSTRILFSGNFERSLYNNIVLKRDFSWTISRVDVLDYIRLTFAADSRISYAPTQKDLLDLLAAPASREKFIVAETKTEPELWLDILSSGDFYLCLPGMGMPWSHNAFEAMAVGAIPILQYNALFYPALTHSKNCLAYDSLETLKEALEIALNMKPEEVIAMRAQVINYYEKYIATHQIIDEINNFLGSADDTLTFVVPYLNEHQ